MYNINLPQIGELSPSYGKNREFPKCLIQHNSSAKSLRSWPIAIIFLILIIISPLSPTAAEPVLVDGIGNIIIDLPPEPVVDVEVTESLPSGIIYIPESLAIDGTTSSPKEKISGANDGESALTVTWDFGHINNSADQDIAIHFQAVVADVDANQEGRVLAPAVATLIYKYDSGKKHSSQGQSSSVTIVEPDLHISRSFSPSSGWRGDTIDCILSIYHSSQSTAPAYDVNVQDLLPDGLSYVPGSIEIANGPDGSTSDYQGLTWHFPRIDESWDHNHIVELRYKATIGSHVLSGDSLGCLASLHWTSAPGNNTEKRHYTASSGAAPGLIPKLPDLKITLADNPDPVRPGGELTYTISYLNRGGSALGTTVEATFDPNLEFISSRPSPDQGSDHRWTIGDLAQNDTGTIEAIVRARADSPDGSVLTSSAKIASTDGARDQALANTRVNITAAQLVINKTASDLLIRPGGTIDYTINYRNGGSTSTSNVTITDIVDPNLVFDPTTAQPAPSIVWSDGVGTHLYWNATTLNTQSFAPGASGQIKFQVSLPSIPAHPEFDRVFNYYRINSDQTDGDYCSWASRTSTRAPLSSGWLMQSEPRSS